MHDRLVSGRLMILLAQRSSGSLLAVRTLLGGFGFDCRPVVGVGAGRWALAGARPVAVITDLDPKDLPALTEAVARQPHGHLIRVDTDTRPAALLGALGRLLAAGATASAHARARPAAPAPAPLPCP